jgi:hypothetical protein
VDLQCLSRIPDSNFFHPVSRGQNDTESRIRIRSNAYTYFIQHKRKLHSVRNEHVAVVITRAADPDPNWIVDPDPYSESGSASGSRKAKNFFSFVGYYSPGSGLVFSLKCWIRIRMKCSVDRVLGFFSSRPNWLSVQAHVLYCLLFS